MACEERCAEYLLYLEPSRVFACELPEKADFNAQELRVHGPVRTKFGSPLSALYDMSRAEEYFRQYLKPLCVRPCSKLHIIADIPAFIRAWRFEAVKLAECVASELEACAPEIVPQAPADCLWYVFDMKMKPASPEAKMEKAVLLGLGEEICAKIWAMARAGGCEAVSVCPLSILSLVRQVRLQETENGFALFCSAASGTRLMAQVDKKDGVMSVEDISEMRFGFSEELLRLCENSPEGSVSTSMISDGVQDRNLPPKLPENLRELPGLANGSVTKESVREIFHEYALTLGEGGCR